MKILFIHHVSAYGGSSRSMLETMNELKRNGCDVSLVCPNGDVKKIALQNEINVIGVTPISQFYHSRFGLYRGFRWLILLREILYLVPNFLMLLKVSWKHSFDIIHINEYSILFSLFLAKKLFKCPIVTHVRALQENRKGLRRYNFVQNVLYRYSSAVIAIDKNVYSTLRDKEKTKIIHNSLDIKVSDSKTGGNNKNIVTFSMIGVMLKYKGVWEFVKAAQEFQKRNLPAKFTFIGGSIRSKATFKNKILKLFGLYEDTVTEIQSYIKSHKINNIEFLGFQTDLEKVYSNTDVVCFPSHLDAPGRPVLEAALYSKPCIVAISEPKDDTIIDGETAICIKSKDYMDLFKAMLELYNNRNLREEMGEKAQKLARENFNIRANTQKLLAIYNSI